MMDMGKLLISGRGKDTRGGVGYWLIILIIAAAIIVLGVFLANRFGYRTLGGTIGGAFGNTFGVNVPRVRTGLYNLFIWGSIVLAGGFIVYMIYYSIRYAKTEIFIYENGVEGTGITKDGENESLTAFNLNYDKIDSIDIVEKWAVSVNAHGRAYLTYVPNANEIVGAVNSRLQLKR